MPWSWDGKTAVATMRSWKCSWVPSHPEAGLGPIQRASENPSRLRPLQLLWEPESGRHVLGETYIRESEFHVSYSAASRNKLHRRIVLRILRDDHLQVDGLEVVIHTHTDLLDSNPLITSHTTSDPGVTLRSYATSAWKELPCNPPDAISLSPPDPGLFLIRDLTSHSYVEMVLPSDFRGARIEQSTGESSISYPMFTPGLEKGVIRMGRIRCYWVPCGHDLETAERLF
ncbi:MAG TPA: hypothetical protein VIY86_13695, partial [Pirellulaceae bacterium]